MAGELLVGGSCVAGTTFGAVEIAERTGATVAVINAVAGGTATLAFLCMVGVKVATVGCYVVSACKR
ncbi:MAG: hypothetical protein OXF02_03615 [Simkaniaceae bacterium]|nr:hypothetical protein [Simkaniaceae bacterium]